MALMRFLKLSLVSQKERRAFQIDLSSPKALLVAGNGFGKSVILKSLYECLGAKPHKVDDSWRSADAIALLDFSLDGEKFSALRIRDDYTIFGPNRDVICETNSITSVLGPFLGNLLNFKLTLADRQEEIRLPPPSYVFAPFYIDQDRSWQKSWDAFRDLGMFPGSARALSEYHSGLKPNAYYEAKARRDRLKIELSKISGERAVVVQATERVEETMANTPLVLDLDVFKYETNKLVTESQNLHEEERRFRNKLASAREEERAWSDHVVMLKAAVAELNDTFKAATDHPVDVECPMCGHHYANNIADQFELAADRNDLVLALEVGQARLREAKRNLDKCRSEITSVEQAVLRVEQVLATRREEIALHDVIAAEGKKQALGSLRRRQHDLDKEYGEKHAEMMSCEEAMAEADNPKRRAVILEYFYTKLKHAALALDVRLPKLTANTLLGVNIGRGSEGPRALAAYYFAFLHTAHEYGSATFCPVVIDAPNQQGQDSQHLDRVMRFLLSDLPSDCQIIVGTEVAVENTEAAVIDVSWKKNQILRDAEYENVVHYLSGYLSQGSLF